MASDLFKKIGEIFTPVWLNTRDYFSDGSQRYFRHEVFNWHQGPASGKHPQTLSFCVKAGAPSPPIAKVAFLDQKLLKPAPHGEFKVVWCERYGSGELSNYPVCDGSGIIKHFEAVATISSAIKLSHRGALNPDFLHPIASPSGDSNGEVADHSSIGRSDPLDATRGAGYGARESGRIGSAPSYEDFDN